MEFGGSGADVLDGPDLNEMTWTRCWRSQGKRTNSPQTSPPGGSHAGVNCGSDYERSLTLGEELSAWCATRRQPSTSVRIGTLRVSMAPRWQS